MNSPEEAQGVNAGRGGAIRDVAALGLAALITRGELAALELAEARDRAGRWLALAIVGGVLLLAALLVSSLWIVSIFWDTHRSQAIAVVAVVYAAAGGGLLWWLLARLRSAPPLLQGTFDELKRDADALRGPPRDAP